MSVQTTIADGASCPPTITMDLSALVLTPVALIPPEILVSAISEMKNEPIELMQLALVCRSWRDVVLGTGELWSHITVTSNTTKTQLLRQIKLSGQTLLALKFECNLPEDLAEFISGRNSSRPIVERVSSLQVHLPYIDETRQIDAISVWQSFFEEHGWPQLKKLLLRSKHRRLRVQLRAPNLKMVDLDQAELRKWSQVGLGSALCEVRWVSYGSYGDVAAILSAIAHCPNLRRLELDADTGSFVLPALPTDVLLWPKLTEIDLMCVGAGLADILTMLFHAPHLAMLRLVCDIKPQSNRHILPIFRPLSHFRKLSIELFADSDNRSDVQMLGLALLQGVFDLHDPSALDKIKLDNFVFPQCGIPAFCPQLQEVDLTNVVLPHGFTEGLNECPMLHRLAISESTARGIIRSGRDEEESASSLVFSGSTFTGAFTQLRTILLQDVTICPKFVAKLAQYLQLEEVNLRRLSIGEDLGTAEIDGLEVGAISPLPKLRQLRFDFHAELDNSPFSSLLTPTAQYIISAAAQLASRVTSGIISLRRAPLRADDVARLLVNPGRELSNVKISFKTDDSRLDALDLSFEADTGDIREIGMPKLFRLEAVVMRTELASVADVIFDRFPLGYQIHSVHLGNTASIMADMAQEPSPGTAGLQYLQRCAADTAIRNYFANECSESSASDDLDAFC